MMVLENAEMMVENELDALKKIQQKENAILGIELGRTSVMLSFDF